VRVVKAGPCQELHRTKLFFGSNSAYDDLFLTVLHNGLFVGMNMVCNMLDLPSTSE
jgi:hypothetical protein